MDYRQSAEITLLHAKAQQRWNRNRVTAWGGALFFVAILIYGLFSFLDPSVARPLWFRVSTYVFLGLASGAAAMLCFRNSRSKGMPSGSLVWQLLGWGLVSEMIAQIIMLFWEQVFHLRPDISPADPFFMGFYLLFAGALGLLITRQKLTLNLQQGLVVLGASVLAIIIAVQLINTAHAVISVPSPQAHPWGLDFIRSFQHLADGLSLFYILADVVLAVMATILSMGFWGGRLATSWQVMAQALVCICVADIWFAYLAKGASYRSGDLMELLWLAGLLQISIAAALEAENALRIQRLIRR